ncbi:major facilitator superfamily domain-containing protein [Spinellus fusiger]|nr:major facilitator superfamily domain-containing protein [Spinellus fusiger]
MSKIPMETLNQDKNCPSVTSGIESNRSLIYNGRYDMPISTEERALLRKIDWHILPLVCIIDFLQFLDKSAINYALVLGINDDTNMSGNQFNIVASLFYLGYLCYQFPNNYFLQHIRIGRYIGILLIVWGGILAATASAKNFSQLAALRFCLGFAEAGVYPCLILLISTMYRRSEQAMRLGIFWLCNGVALGAGGLISYGFGSITQVANIHPWRWCMLILGLVTIVVGVICFFFLIDDPRSLRWHYNAEEQLMVEERIRDNAVMRTSYVNHDQIREALREPRFWCFCFASLFLNLQNGAMTSYSAAITAGFGFSNMNAILLQIPTGLVDVLYILGAVFLSQRIGQTIYVACGCLMGASIGLLLLEFIPVSQYKLVGLYFFWGYAAAYVMIIATISTNVSGFTKKIFYNGMIMIFYTIGNFTGPYMLVPSQAPHYIGGILGYIGANILCILLLLYARWSMSKVNRRRLTEPPTEPTLIEDDLTDKQDENFIYRL